MDGPFLGMISGTSMDGVDAALVRFGGQDCTILAARTTPYSASLRERLERLVRSPAVELVELGELDRAVGRHFAACANALLAEAGNTARDIQAIGHHGQTIFHQPRGNDAFSLQIGDPNTVAAETGIITVADFRRLDIAVGGQGAPLLPAFHAWRFADPRETRVILNIGGIANVTVLTPRAPPLGFDTGPGNTLLDQWSIRMRGEPFDRAGAWAANGQVCEPLLASMLTEPFFALPPPKSTGRELFNWTWLGRHLPYGARAAAADVQATLAELTAATIAASIACTAPSCGRIVVCGGGAHNLDLLARLARRTGVMVEASDTWGVAADYVEAAGFAWLARARLSASYGNLPSVTGARRAVQLGAVYSPLAAAGSPR